MDIHKHGESLNCYYDCQKSNLLIKSLFLKYYLIKNEIAFV
ncbi:hypothetical protein AO370_0336 [Moraxella catarrhalis]|uniref:Uncharacterized protein n=1 Tax=Moraxella catarrhalis TaxID=480 RepID=A0AB36DQL0_MORCA|nr:hypothetical protein AO370_0336 [Moraxella catarrhalis]